ncbi:SDR family NAD(P)-dependent oxidoreductase [Demequina sp. SYSU T00039]|uniref:SDR family NAD(P)-dependent oxidoreductase n=1 Tax=Demequina lignilytica TaxID=3051663 RepID=A0AAW7M8I4_9MICO|nr:MULTISPECIES: SDR family NAD(P)-dependent oxidoreductase [unclassified Demequina]MDN4477034.1 SDR family NAD(P)-dependent oxidoreductase [Demequina sp. SYSU T00039-1]MDN4487207.1 SDR family NAD(P)-dependent oxidoreductase [Demequina sp. SYSU T00039]MDN4491798.1 SDR family NAD(P)-dependent oxidoreductase [Demequina sp. SYSU T00068]
MTWTAADIPDQSGRVAVVTGANGGLGLACTIALARRGAHVVMAARSPEKTDDAHAAVLAAVPGASLETVPLDLASQESVRSAGRTIADRHGAIDLLLANAGVMAMPEGRTADDFETQLAVNHLGHWTLIAELLPRLMEAPAARVVTTTSIARLNADPVDPANPHLDGEYEDWKAYGRSKLAAVHLAVGLDRRLRAAGSTARALVAHPGISHTDLQKRTVREGGGGTQGPFWERYAERRGMDPARGALSQLRAATDPRAEGGTLYGPRWGVTGAPTRRPLLTRRGMDGAIAALWTASEELTGVALEVPAEVTR